MIWGVTPPLFLETSRWKSLAKKSHSFHRGFKAARDATVKGRCLEISGVKKRTPVAAMSMAQVSRKGLGSFDVVAFLLVVKCNIAKGLLPKYHVP